MEQRSGSVHGWRESGGDVVVCSMRGVARLPLATQLEPAVPIVGHPCDTPLATPHGVLAVGPDRIAEIEGEDPQILGFGGDLHLVEVVTLATLAGDRSHVLVNATADGVAGVHLVTVDASLGAEVERVADRCTAGALARERDGTLVVACASGDVVTLLTPETGAAPRQVTLDFGSDWPDFMELDRDARQLAVSDGFDTFVVDVDDTRLTLRTKLDSPGVPGPQSWHPDGTRLAGVFQLNEAFGIWDARTGELLESHVVDHDDSLRSAGWVEDGSALFAPSVLNTVSLYRRVGAQP